MICTILTVKFEIGYPLTHNSFKNSNKKTDDLPSQILFNRLY